MDGDPRPDQLDDAERPGAGEQTATGEGEDETATASLEGVHQHHERERSDAEQGQHGGSLLAGKGTRSNREDEVKRLLPVGRGCDRHLNLVADAGDVELKKRTAAVLGGGQIADQLLERIGSRKRVDMSMQPLLSARTSRSQ